MLKTPPLFVPPTSLTLSRARLPLLGWVAAFVLGGAGSACQKSPEAAPALPAATAVTAAPAKPAAVPPAPPEVRTAAPGIVVPEDVSADKPIPAAKLRAAFSAWHKKPLTVVGYATFSTGDKGKLGYTVNLASSPGSSKEKATVDCSLLPAERNKEADNKMPLTLTGTIWTASPGHVVLHDCTLVAEGKPAKADTLVEPGSKEPVSSDKVVAAYAGWFGKEVTVVGKGNGVTSSTDSKGKVTDVRVDMDIVDAAGFYKNQVGCHIAPSAYSDKLSPIMKSAGDKFTVRGKIEKLDEDKPQLNPCEVISK